MLACRRPANRGQSHTMRSVGGMSVVDRWVVFLRNWFCLEYPLKRSHQSQPQREVARRQLLESPHDYLLQYRSPSTFCTSYYDHMSPNVPRVLLQRSEE